MRLETTQGLYRYWNTVRGARLAPRRYEIEPAQIVPYLAETLIIEQVDDGDCCIRVAGTEVSEKLGVNLKGQSFFDLWSAQDQMVLRDNIRTITEHGSAGFFSLSAALNDEEPAAEFEMLLLPLTHLEGRIDRMLGCLSLSYAPDWLDTMPPSSLKLLSNELIWPDGRPRTQTKVREASLFAAREVPVLRSSGGVRQARLVRNKRRSFLVYDGGLTENPATDEPQS